jgi:alkaline phosphatase D
MLRAYLPQNLLFCFLLSLAACRQPVATTSGVITSAPIQTLAFGSCNRQDLPQPLWPVINKNNPDVWVWLGDNIYGDSDTMAVLRRKYEMVLQEEEYKRLQNQTKIIGVWDDHDYGKNDGGKEYKMKQESAQLFWDFIGEPANSSRRKQAGVYSAHTFGPKKKQVKVILLDSRYHRDALERINGVYQVNQKGDILGEEQWQWLQKELSTSKAAINIIGNGIQVLPQEQVYEKWDNFPASRQRLLNLIAASGAKGVILLSGDRHIAEISKTQLPGMSHPLYEVTSSGLTHVYSGDKTEPNKYRVGDLVKQINFGLFQFEWDKKSVKVEMMVKGSDDKVLLKEVVTY